jgi:osmoprotectant transport system substrate-binding protein
MAALGAASLALIVGACASGGSPSPSTGGTIAGQLVLGGPPECPTRDFCIPGLESVYGLTFREFKPLDTGGPVTVAAIESGDVDVGMLFTSDPSIAAKGFVLLADDKRLQNSDNIAPVIRQEILDEHPGITELLDEVTAELSQEALTELNRQVAVDLVDPADAAEAWLTELGVLPGPGGSEDTEIVVASFNFAESVTLAEVYAQTLEANGFSVERKLNLGTREVIFPSLRAGDLDLLPEYLASALTVAYSGDASTDPAETAAALQAAAAVDGLTVLAWAEATDQNGYVVSATTASEYGLAKLSDLAKPAP